MTVSDDGSAPSSSPAGDDAVRRMRAAAEASGGDAPRGVPGAPGSVDPDVVRSALATLPHDDQRLLWDRHVRGRPLDAVARELGVHVRSATRRLRSAEDRLARALSAAHARGGARQACMETRGALHDYVRHHLGAGRRLMLEDHLFRCAGCMRAFIDVRHAAWALRDTAPLLAGGLAVGTAGPVVVGAAGAAASGTGLVAWWGTVVAALVAVVERVGRGLRQVLGRPVGVAAGVGVAVVAVAAAAVVGGAGAGTSPQAPPPAVAEEPRAAASGAPSASSAPDPSEEPSEEPTEPEPSDEPSHEATPAPTEGPDDAHVQAVRDPEPDPEPAAQPGPTTESPDDPVRDPEPDRPTGPTEPTEPTEPTVPPTAPATAPPSAPPTTSPTSAPPVEPERELETVTLTVRGIGWFRVAPTGGAEIVAVEPVEGYTKAELGWGDHWRVWTANARRGTVEVTVSGEPGSNPGAALRLWDHG
jgi:hypothetical protein